mgnify:CR=1 FL=1
MEINQNNIELFWKFVTERQDIYYKRFILKQEKPWSNDRIFQEWKFCNIFRKYDTGTQFLIQEIIEKIDDRNDLLLNMIIYRIFNRIETTKIIGNVSYKNFDIEDIKQKLKKHKEKGNKIFTNAFLMTGVNFTDLKDIKDKIDLYCWSIEKIKPTIPELVEILQNSNGKNLQNFFLRLIQFKGIGNFLSHVICSDVLHKEKFGSFTENWCYFGRGAEKGINLIFNNIKKNKYLEAIEYLQKEQKMYFKKFNLDFKYCENSEIGLFDIENSLCEFSKYYKIKEGTGRARLKFEGI